MTLLVASGGEVDIMNFIGNHGCSKTPASLFNDNGTMRAAGTKACLVKVLREETCVTAVPNLPHQNLKTAVCRWSFLKDETAATGISADWHTERHRQHTFLLRQVQSSEPEVSRATACMRQAKQFEISEHYTVPNQQELFSLSPNKAGLPQLPVWKMVRRGAVGGGFKDETKSVLVTAGIVTDVAALASTQQEADTRVILHSIHSLQKEDVEWIIIHTNDTDTVVISCVYYASTLLRDLSELSMWVRTARDGYLPIHGIAAAVGPSSSHALPFIHSLS